jgi:hypothetical protein
MKKLIQAWRSHVHTKSYYVYDPETEKYEEERYTVFTGFPAYVILLLGFSIAGLLSFCVGSMIAY